MNYELTYELSADAVSLLYVHVLCTPDASPRINTQIKLDSSFFIRRGLCSFCISIVWPLCEREVCSTTWEACSRKAHWWRSAGVTLSLKHPWNLTLFAFRWSLNHHMTQHHYWQVKRRVSPKWTYRSFCKIIDFLIWGGRSNLKGNYTNSKL